MMRPNHGASPTRSLFARRLAGVFVVMLGLSMWVPAHASDHGDTDRLIKLGRHDARIADFYVFTRGQRLVLAATYQAELPKDLSTFSFPSDVTYRFMIDRDSAVTYDDKEQVRLFGGTIVNPDDIREDVVVEICFRDGGGHSFKVTGLEPGPDHTFAFFSGVRDEPFIRSTVIGKNIAAIVVELPLLRVISGPDKPTILAWATTDLRKVRGSQDELGGRAYRSMFPDGHHLNTLHPSRHHQHMKVAPDVVIFDTSRPAAFPNGRDLTDDVVDLLGRPDGEPFPSENDVAFLPQFPYLAPPHPPVATP